MPRAVDNNALHLLKVYLHNLHGMGYTEMLAHSILVLTGLSN